MISIFFFEIPFPLIINFVQVCVLGFFVDCLLVFRVFFFFFEDVYFLHAQIWDDAFVSSEPLSQVLVL